MAPPPTLPRQRLRYTRILEVAAGYARKGLDSVVLSEVAAQADVPLGTLYRYFPSPTQLVLALYRKQLAELHAPEETPAPSSARTRAASRAHKPAPAGPGPARRPVAGTGANGPAQTHALVAVAMEIFHMRLMQPAVEQCLSKAVYVKGSDTTRLLREIDALAEQAVTAVSDDVGISRVLLLTVTGLVQSVRCRRLSLFEAEEALKKACALLSGPRGAA
ncbi:AcrR family transcriptional regulator [Arthrobacter sp. V4I6]|nr:AcrR family transcriptional regulator [Arthrobacter sp. V4I6]